ncbi:substrate-binding periplasmic protein [Sneathiella limimaris]|uniref:substrate-binding periplasmic protein n=1 Tax=Sneathiella limimaris TaxID=1964213 RepID=UPI001469FBE5|nr:ABC transporter substrate-binding protein [Sneathiella limimaris]
MSERLTRVLIGLCMLFSSVGLSQANEENKLRILMSPIPPLVMSSQADQRGVLYEIALEVARRWGNSPQSGTNSSVQLEILPWSRAYAELLKHPNVVMLQMARTPEREAEFQWLDQTGNLSFAFISKNPPAINSLEEARDLNLIAVYRESRLENFLKQNGFSNLAPTDNSKTSARLLDAERVQLWYASVQEALWLHKNGFLVSKPVVGTPIFQTPIWAVTSRKTKLEVVEHLTKVLSSIHKDGTIDLIRNEYGLGPFKAS